MSASAEVPTFVVPDPDLSWIRVDYEVQFRFGEVEVRLGSAFRLTLDGETFNLSARDHVDLGPVLRVFPGACRDLAADADGTLRLSLEGGAVITASPSDEFEAWAVAGAGQRLVVCAPGGTLAVWD
jgi:hypothetical protein